MKKINSGTSSLCPSIADKKDPRSAVPLHNQLFAPTFGRNIDNGSGNPSPSYESIPMEPESASYRFLQSD